MLIDADYQAAATTLGCEVAAVRAITEVESAGTGFLPDGRPKILFEAHWFSDFTGGRYDRSHPTISSPKWNRALYKGGAAEYERLALARSLDREAAFKSCSWGAFQIMGFNHAACGYPDVDSFVVAMNSDAGQLQAFIQFIQSQKLASFLQQKDWAGFARRYNGPGYKANNYDLKIAKAYQKFLAAAAPPIIQEGGETTFIVTAAPGTWLKALCKQSSDLPNDKKTWIETGQELSVRQWKEQSKHYCLTLESGTFWIYTEHCKVKAAGRGQKAEVISPYALPKPTPVPVPRSLLRVPCYEVISPYALPKPTLAQKIIEYLKSKGWEIEIGQDQYQLVYLEGANADGTPNDDRLGAYNDRRIILTETNGRPEIVFNALATTEPSRQWTMKPMNPLGAARIAFGPFRAWQVGYHNGRRNHEALVQVRPITVHRDFNKDGFRTGDKLDTGLFGVNHHHGGNGSIDDIGLWSAGCQVCRAVDEHFLSMSILKRDRRYLSDKAGFVFASTVIPGDELYKFWIYR